MASDISKSDFDKLTKKSIEKYNHESPQKHAEEQAKIEHLNAAFAGIVGKDGKPIQFFAAPVNGKTFFMSTQLTQEQMNGLLNVSHHTPYQNDIKSVTKDSERLTNALGLPEGEHAYFTKTEDNRLYNNLVVSPNIDPIALRNGFKKVEREYAAGPAYPGASAAGAGAAAVGISTTALVSAGATTATMGTLIGVYGVGTVATVAGAAAGGFGAGIVAAPIVIDGGIEAFRLAKKALGFNVGPRSEFEKDMMKFEGDLWKGVGAGIQAVGKEIGIGHPQEPKLTSDAKAAHDGMNEQERLALAIQSAFLNDEDTKKLRKGQVASVNVNNNGGVGHMVEGKNQMPTEHKLLAKVKYVHGELQVLTADGKPDTDLTKLVGLAGTKSLTKLFSQAASEDGFEIFADAKTPATNQMQRYYIAAPKMRS